MPDSSGKQYVSQIRLVENVEPLSGIVIGGQGDLPLIRSDGAGYEILVSPVVAAEHRAIAKVEAARLMLDRSRPEIDQRPDIALVRISEKSGNCRVGRSSLERRNASIGGAAVAELLVAERDPGLFPSHECEGRGQAIAFQIDISPEAV